jgi:DNA-binding response OmpR family regulator
MMLRSIQKAGASVAHILSVCDDEGLRVSRELLLQKDGYQTESIESNTAVTVRRVRSFDLALICRSVDRGRAIALIEMLRRYHPALQILCIAPLDSSANMCHADLEGPSGPQALLNAIRSLLQQRTGTPKLHDPGLSKQPVP